jgi:hypothetical protein
MIRAAAICLLLAAPAAAETVAEQAARAAADARPIRVARQGQHLHGDAHQTVDAPVADRLEGDRRVLHRTMDDTFDPHAGEPLAQQIAHAVGQVAGQKNQHPFARTHQGGHAVVEEIDGGLQLFAAEEEPLGRARGPRGAQGDHPGHLALGDAQQIQRILAQILR